jgi:hypothetical protein
LLVWVGKEIQKVLRGGDGALTALERRRPKGVGGFSEKCYRVAFQVDGDANMAVTSASSKRKHVMKGQPLGKEWKKVVEEILMKDGAKQGRAQLKTGAQTTEDSVVVRIPITFFVRFPRKGKTITGDGRVDCACTEGSPGGADCICRGACDFPACCDAIVVKA